MENAENQATSAKDEYVEERKAEIDKLNAEITEIEAAADDRWEDLKDGVENVWMSLKQGFEKVKARF